MSEREEPIRDMNPIEYLRDFINTQLVLTFEEEAIINYFYDKQRGLPVRMPVIKKNKKAHEKIATRQCRFCGEFLPVSEFYKGYAICKKCFSVHRKQKRLER